MVLSVVVQFLTSDPIEPFASFHHNVSKYICFTVIEQGFAQV